MKINNLGILLKGTLLLVVLSFALAFVEKKVDKEVIFCPENVIYNIELLDQLKFYTTYSDSVFGKKTIGFYIVVIQQQEYQDVCFKITRITPSSWFIIKHPPSNVFEIDSNIFLFYTGLEVLFDRKEFSKEIITNYNNILHDDILPNGDYNNYYSFHEFKTWEICLIDDSIKIKINVNDPFRPRVIKEKVVH